MPSGRSAGTGHPGTSECLCAYGRGRSPVSPTIAQGPKLVLRAGGQAQALEWSICKQDKPPHPSLQGNGSEPPQRARRTPVVPPPFLSLFPLQLLIPGCSSQGSSTTASKRKSVLLTCHRGSCWWAPRQARPRALPGPGRAPHACRERWGRLPESEQLLQRRRPSCTAREPGLRTREVTETRPEHEHPAPARVKIKGWAGGD